MDTNAGTLLQLCADQELSIATAESLTGGLLVAKLIDVPGASSIVQGGACTYSFEAKAALLELDVEDLYAYGAVRESVARDMARGAMRMYGADVGLATTGVAGPGPDPYGVQEGTVFVACATKTGVRVGEMQFTGDRAAIRAGAVDAGIILGVEVLRAGL